MSPLPVSTVPGPFGPLVSPWDVEQAVVATLNKWLWPSYLEGVEEAHGLVPGTTLRPSSIHGGADLTAWNQEIVPAVIVVCEQPQGEPERFASDGYSQGYDVTVGAIVVNDDEDLGRRDAGFYAAAIMGAVVHQLAADNPGLVTDAVLTGSPAVELQDPELRLEYTGHVAFEVYVSPTIIRDAGPQSPIPAGQTPEGYPQVQTTNPTLVTKPIT